MPDLHEEIKIPKAFNYLILPNIIMFVLALYTYMEFDVLQTFLFVWIAPAAGFMIYAFERTYRRRYVTGDEGIIPLFRAYCIFQTVSAVMLFMFTWQKSPYPWNSSEMYIHILMNTDLFNVLSGIVSLIRTSDDSSGGESF